MIERYSLPEMKKIWSEENKFKIWLEVEILACEAQTELGVVPKDAVKNMRAKAQFEIARINEIENTVKHDVIAFLTNVAEYVGSDSRYIHLGMTSSDLLDTALSVQMRQSGKLLLQGLEQLKQAIRKQAIKHKNTACIGRSHGVHAEPTTFGLKLAVWYAEIDRHLKRLNTAIDSISVGKISGAVGTFANIDPSVEKYVCEKLELSPAPISTQIVQRDRHAEYLNAIALIGASLEKFATEIRSLQRTEVLEAEEPFTKGQKGSSAMPHKRNPIICERITGLARLLRSNAATGMENIALWHERDISHSSVERIILPDSTILLDYMLHRFTKVIANLQVYPDNMSRNLEITNGLIFSQQVLLALTQKGMAREEAYKYVQENAMLIWNSSNDNQLDNNFKNRLKADKSIEQYLTAQEIDQCFDLARNFRHVDTIFERLGLT